MKKQSILYYLPFITIFFGTLFQIFFLYSQDFLFLLFNTLPDDAFYYFQTARNMVAGLGSTFDGVNLGNGYHPLWMFLLLPIFKFFSIGGTNDIAPIYAALTFSIFLSFLTSIILYKILRNFTENKKIISFGIFIYLFSPYLIYNVLNGLETALVLLLLSIFIYSFILFEKKQSRRNLLFIGVSGGLLALARLDMVVVVALTNLIFLYKKQMNYFFISGLTSAIIFFSWMIYNFKMFGMYLTSASLTSTFVNHRLTYSDNGGYSVGLFLKTIVYMLERAMQQIVGDTGAPIIFLMLTGVGIYFVIKNFSISNFSKSKYLPIIFATLGLLTLVFVSAGLRWTFRSWYFIPLLIPFTVFIVWTVEKIIEDIKYKNIFLGVLVLGISFSYFVTWIKDLKDREILQRTMYEATLWQNKNLPEGSRIGVFNAGLQAYFSKHNVVNLDGLINNNSSKAMLNNTLWQYVTEIERLEYISDFDSYMTYRYKDSLRDKDGNLLNIISTSTMEKIHTIKGPKDINIYKIIYR